MAKTLFFGILFSADVSNRGFANSLGSDQDRQNAQSKLFDTDVNIFEKVNFEEKNQQTTTFSSLFGTLSISQKSVTQARK